MHALIQGALEPFKLTHICIPRSLDWIHDAPITCAIPNAPISATFALAPTSCRVQELVSGLASRKRPPTAAATLATPCGDARIIDFTRNTIAKMLSGHGRGNQVR
jgi:hypothetical protein